MQEMLDELTARKPVPVAKDGRLSVAESASAIVRDFEHLAENAEFYRLMLGRHGVADFRFHLQEYVYDVTAQRLQISLGNLPTGPVQTEIVLNYIATAYIGIFQWWLENDMPYTPEYMASQFIKLYRLGVYQALGLEADIAGAELEN